MMMGQLPTSQNEPKLHCMTNQFCLDLIGQLFNKCLGILLNFCTMLLERDCQIGNRQITRLYVKKEG